MTQPGRTTTQLGLRFPPSFLRWELRSSAFLWASTHIISGGKFLDGLVLFCASQSSRSFLVEEFQDDDYLPDA